MKKTIRILLAILLVSVLALALASCSRCLTSGHKWNDGDVITPANCGTDGVKKLTCTVCGTTAKEVIPATGNHSWSGWGASSIEGKQERYCFFCYKKDYRDECRHENLEKHDEQAPIDCFTDGNVEYYECHDCGKLFADAECKQEISLADTVVSVSHDISIHHERQEAQCTTDGVEEYWECDVCGTLFSDAQGKRQIDEPVSIPALKHRFAPNEAKGEDGFVWGEDGASVVLHLVCIDGDATLELDLSEKIMSFRYEVCGEQHSTVYHVLFDRNMTDLLDGNEIASGVKNPLNSTLTIADEGPIVGHVLALKDTEFTWNVDAEVSITLYFECENCEKTISKNITDGIVSNTESATCVSEGKTTYTFTLGKEALANLIGNDTLAESVPATLTATKEVTLKATDHNYDNATWTHDSLDDFGYHHALCNSCGQARIEEECSIVGNTCSVCDNGYTVKEILDALYSLASGKKLNGTFTLTGIVTDKGQLSGSSNSILLSVFDGEENREVLAYRATGTGDNTYAKAVIGSRVTVVGELKNYSGTREFDPAIITNIELPDYSMTVAQWDGEAIEEVTYDKTIYQAGEEVTITVVPKKDWAVTVVVTLDGSDKTLEVTVNGNEYSFVMIGDVNVTITAESIKGREDLHINATNLKLTASYTSRTHDVEGFKFNSVDLYLNTSNNIQWKATSSKLTGTSAIGTKIFSVALRYGTNSSYKFVVEFADNAEFANSISKEVTLSGGVATVAPSDIAGYKADVNYTYVAISHTASGAAYLNEIVITYQDCLHEDVENHREVESTCFEQGTAEYWECRVCSKLFANADCTEKIDEPQKLELKPHNWIVDVNQGDEGWTWDVANGAGTATVALKCNNLNCTATHDVTVAVTYKVTDTPTCTAEGQGTYTASVSYGNFAQEKTYSVHLDKVPHTYDEKVWQDDADEGHYHICQECKLQVEEEKIPHVYVEYENEGDKHVALCMVCSHYFESQHTWSSKPIYVDGDWHQYECTAAGCGATQEKQSHVYDQAEGKCECGAEQGHVHTMIWDGDSSEHWRRCENCDYVEDTTRAKHSYDVYSSNGSTNHNAHCLTCDANVTLDHNLKYEDWESIDEHYEYCEDCDWEEMTPHNFVNGKCQDCNAAEPVWELVTDASNLKEGDQIIIVATKQDYAMASQNSSGYRNRIAITKDGNLVEINDSVQIIVLVQGTKEGTFGFNVGGTNYLCAPEADSNNIKTNSLSAVTDAASWSIEITADGVATVKAQCSGRVLLSHNNQAQRFACYSAVQTDISIYKLTAGGTTNGEGSETETPDPEVPVDPTEKAWKLVTNLDVLDSDVKVVFVSKDGAYVAGSLGSNSYMSRVAVSTNNNVIDDMPANALQLTLGKDGNNWTFADSNGNLLGQSSLSSNNSLTMSATSSNTTWSIVLNGDGTVRITNTAGTSTQNVLLQYSSNNSRFSNYKSTSGMADFLLYAFV